MAEIIPFKGILYNVSKVSMEDVLAPPYDIITPDYKEELYRKSPYNIVRIDFGKDQPGDSKTDNRYTRARLYFEEWLYKEIFIQSKTPSFYAYGMDYKIKNKVKRLLGFLGLVKLEELGKGSIYPHECTYSNPKKDRLNLLVSCEANVSPIFSLYKSTENHISTLLSGISLKKPYMESKDTEGAVHRLWPIDKKKDIEIIKRELNDKAIFIADGHHRYETALEFQREKKNKKIYSIAGEPSDYTLMFLANMLDEGLTVLPTHRLLKKIPDNIIKKLSEHFEVEPVKEDFKITKKMSGKKHVFGFYQKMDKVWYLLKYRKNNLLEIVPDIDEIDVIVLHDILLRKMFNITDVEYEMDINKALD
ncbi:MAG TPA: DUF1015 domain-containing protein, partial [Candidatus Humimicrobiaceae bacterium]|nr:DUF1015 domain-containing protein [Candidatus Humimicrobiaceae bacterium]